MSYDSKFKTTDLYITSLDSKQNKYELVLLAAKRARAIGYGTKPLIDNPFVSPVDNALEEILQGKINNENIEKSSFVSQDDHANESASQATLEEYGMAYQDVTEDDAEVTSE